MFELIRSFFPPPFVLPPLGVCRDWRQA